MTLHTMCLWPDLQGKQALNAQSNVAFRSSTSSLQMDVANGVFGRGDVGTQKDQVGAGEPKRLEFCNVRPVPGLLVYAGTVALITPSARPSAFILLCRCSPLDVRFGCCCCRSTTRARRSRTPSLTLRAMRRT